MSFILQHIWLILGGIILLLIGGGYLLISTGWLNRIMDWLKPDSDKYVRAKVFCEDKNIRDRKLKIGRYCIQDDKRRLGWHLVHGLYVKSASTGKQFLCLSERDSFPLDFEGKLTPEIRKQYPTARQVFIDSTADIRSQAAKEGNKSIMSSTVSIIAICAALVFVVMAIILFWRGHGSMSLTMLNFGGLL